APERGRMLLLLHAQQSVTVPRLCLNQSRFEAQKMFLRMLKGAVGFEVVEMKETPKNFMYGKVQTVNSGKKFRNQFAVCFEEPPSS
ncbi:hypothetical protein TeGR_g11798, partial [Tetraparma gracilis]